MAMIGAPGCKNLFIDGLSGASGLSGSSETDRFSSGRGANGVLLIVAFFGPMTVLFGAFVGFRLAVPDCRTGLCHKRFSIPSAKLPFSHSVITVCTSS
jgi:hypothetical protein